ncbi:MAG: sulfotransferase domain-containing protein [Chloroflexaceae bacterium]|nr:sulfotransferase domain-containing protein [Chloroflexaceae bacterium]
MLVVSNGAFKSGSTWLFHIVRRITDFPSPPDTYLRNDRHNPVIDPARLNRLLADLDINRDNYAVKNHFSEKSQQQLLLSRDYVRVLNIERDLRDVVVSAYYHYCRVEHDEIDFATYYWHVGRHTADRIRRYNLLWRVDHPHVYVSSYKQLKTNFVEETKHIGSFLGFELTDDAIIAIYEATTFKSFQQQTGQDKKPERQRFFRKGIMGDYANHFDQAMMNDIAHIEQHGLDYLSRVRISLWHTVRRQMRRRLLSRSSTQVKS